MNNYLLDEKLLENIIKKVKKKKYTKENILCENSIIKNDSELKCYLFHYQIKANKCEKCNLQLWQGKMLELLIYRKNSKLGDNSLSNIKLLCPNCYSLKEKKGVFIHINKSKMGICIDCGRRFKKKIIKESINPICDLIYDKKPVKHKYIKKRCDFCLNKEIQKKDYTKLNEIKKSDSSSNKLKKKII